MPHKYAEIVFPLTVEKSFYYLIPEELRDSAVRGVRAVAPFGKRIMTGYIINVSDKIADTGKALKYIEDILDTKPIFTEKLMDFCKWVAEYYFSSLGDVLKAAVPYGSDVESRRSVVVEPEHIITELNKQTKKDTNYFKLLALLTTKSEYSINELSKKFTGTNLNYNLQKLESKGLCTIFVEKQKPKVSIKTETLISLSEEVIKEFDKTVTLLEKKAPKQVNLLVVLYTAAGRKMFQKELLEKAKTNSAVLNQLIKKNLVYAEEIEVKREYTEKYEEKEKSITLNADQQKVFDIISKSIEENKFRTFLLHGVTSSGKTQVYLELMKKVVERGQTAIYLVPEISLTPQVIRRVQNFFGKRVGVLHSRMSLGEKYDQWRSVINGECDIVVGPRSAIFAPLKNVGIIIVDEEHDYSYKQQESSPYYNARDGAIIRAYQENAIVVLGSATPSVESYYNALSGKYALLELNKRADDAVLPQISFINMKDEKAKKELQGIYSKELIEKINEKIKKNEKVILLQNRRGFATYIMCPDCGHTEICKNCTVSLTYHLPLKQYVCHYCGYSRPEAEACPQCGSIGIKFRGIGTQRVEDELEALLPGIKLVRMDLDTTTKKGAYSQILNDFSSGKYNVLLGTQMVAKGLDFPDVTLVGVISAEASLLFPDFRSAERTFQLLSQVAGRAGRKLPGEVIIQTYHPGHYVLEHVQNHNYKGFYKEETENRSNAQYPPYVKIALVEFKGTNAQSVKSSAKNFYGLLKYDPMIIKVLGPAPAMIYKLNKKYRYNIIIKSKRNLDPNGKILHNVIRRAANEFYASHRTANVRVSIDIDPMSLV